MSAIPISRLKWLSIDLNNTLLKENFMNLGRQQNFNMVAAVGNQLSQQNFNSPASARAIQRLSQVLQNLNEIEEKLQPIADRIRQKIQQIQQEIQQVEQMIAQNNETSPGTVFNASA